MIDNALSIKTLQSMDELFVIISQYTGMPYVECDPETFDDQIHIMSSEEAVQKFAKEYAQKKIALMVKKLPKAQAPAVLTSMYGIGINVIMFHHDGTVARIHLDKLVQKPDIETLKKEKFPVINPTLMLSALYFLEELHRPVEHDKKLLRELEEELIANLVRSNYILAMTPSDPEEKIDPKNPDQKKSVSYIKDKDGQIFLPVFSDFSELQKFYREKTNDIAMLVLPFAELKKNVVKEARGLLLNPASFRLQIVMEQLDKIMSDFFS